MSQQTDMHAALKECDDRYRHLVESASDGIYRIDTKGYFLYANPVIARTLGAPQGVIGRHYLEFVRPDYHDQIRQFYEDQIDRKAAVTYLEFPTRTADGSDLWIGQHVQVELGPNGEVTGLHAVSRNITDRKRLEDELRQSDKMRVVGQLAGGIAHDFNSILTAISGFADLLIDALGPMDERTRDAIQIRKAADKASRLTAQLLTFSRREVLKSQPLNLNTVIEELRPMLSQLLGNGVDIETKFTDTLTDVYANVSQIEQVLLNVALNARDAMPWGGTFTITTENIHVGPNSSHPEILYPGFYVLLRVTDTGTGMDEATRVKIFEPFFTTKGPGKGTGLGLSTTYGIVTQFGGWIGVESTPNVGSTFSIYLPQIHGITSRESPPHVIAQPHPSNGVVLVADDEAGIRAVLTRVLEAHGYQVIGAANGIDALKKAREHQGNIDLLLTDLVMPRMGGFELAEAFATERPASHVLFMSGYIDEAGLAPLATRRIKLLHKPFDSETVLAEVRSIVPERN